MAHLQLTDGTKITFEGEIQINLLSPLFYDMNTYSLPGRIPNTPSNSRALDRPELINSINNKVREYDVEFVSDILRLQGVLRVKELNDDYFSFNFTGQGAFWNKSGNTPMNELEFEVFDYPIDITTTDFPNDNDAYIFENAYAFIPHFNTIQKKTYPYYNENVEKLFVPANDFWAPPGSSIKRYNQYFLPNNPWLLVKYIVKAYSILKGYYIKKNDLEKSMFDYLLASNNYNLEQLTFSESTDPRDILDVTYLEVIDEKTLELTVSDSSYHFINSLFIKFYNFKIVNKNNINGRIFRPTENSTSGKFQVEIDTSMFSSGAITANVIRMDRAYNAPSTFEIGKHFPNITPKEFFKELEKMFGLISIPGESTHHVIFRLLEDVIKGTDYEDITSISGRLIDKYLTGTLSFGITYSPVEDDFLKERVMKIASDHTVRDQVTSLGDLPLTRNKTNDVRYVAEKDAYYIWKEASYGTRQIDPNEQVYIGNWEFFSEWVDFGDIDGDFVLDTKFAPIPMFKHYLYGWGRDLPRMEIPTNHENSTKETDGGIRLCFLSLDVGFPKGLNSNSYMSLKLHGSNGIYETFHKSTLEWRSNRYRQCKSNIQWPVRMLYDFAWDKKYRIKDTNYLIEKIPVYIRHDDNIRFGPTELART